MVYPKNERARSGWPTLCGFAFGKAWDILLMLSPSSPTSISNSFNAFPHYSNNTQELLDILCMSMLSSFVYVTTNPRDFNSSLFSPRLSTLQSWQYFQNPCLCPELRRVQPPSLNIGKDSRPLTASKPHPQTQQNQQLRGRSISVASKWFTTPLESALAQNDPDNSFRIRTYRKYRGGATQGCARFLSLAVRGIIAAPTK